MGKHKELIHTLEKYYLMIAIKGILFLNEVRDLRFPNGFRNAILENMKATLAFLIWGYQKTLNEKG